MQDLRLRASGPGSSHGLVCFCKSAFVPKLDVPVISENGFNAANNSGGGCFGSIVEEKIADLKDIKFSWLINGVRADGSEMGGAVVS